MSSSSEQDDNLDARDFLPHEPLYYAPSAWRERLRRRPSSPSPSATPSTETAARQLNDATSTSCPLDAELEHAVYQALRRPHDPVVISESAGFFGELDRLTRLISVAGRVAAAVAVAAVVALIIVFTGPGSSDYPGQADGASFGTDQPVKAALIHPPPDQEEAKPALCELQTILGAPQTQPVMTPQQSETLLQQFMQWREKPAAPRNP
jgi:hypothetical protein